MKAVKSDRLLNGLERLLRRLSEIVHSDFAPLSNAQLNWQADSKQWSIGGCVQHLNIISSYYLPLLEEKIGKGAKKQLAAQPLFHSGRLGRYFIKSIQLKEDNRLPSNMRSPKVFRPAPLLNGPQVIKQYLLDQEKFLRILQQARQVNLQKIKVPIAIFKLIRLRLGDMFGFLIYHNERHIVQAQRIFSEDQFPSH